MKVDPRWLDRQALIREFFMGEERKKERKRERERLQNFEVLENIRQDFSKGLLGLSA